MGGSTDDWDSPSEIYIAHGSGEIQIDTGSPDDILTKLQKQINGTKRFVEWYRGLEKKTARDAKEQARRKGQPPPAQIPLKPVQSVVTPPPSEIPPAGGDAPQQQGAPDLPTPPSDVVILKSSPQSSQPLVSIQEPTAAVYDQLKPIPPLDVASLMSPPPNPSDFDAFIARLKNNENEPGERHPTLSSPAARRPAADADPVDLFSGAFTISAVDLAVPTPFIPIVLSRSYRSGRSYFGPFGHGWDHAYNIYLRRLNDGGFALWTGQLREQHFRNAGGGFEPEHGYAARLELMPGFGEAFSIRFPGGTQWLFERPSGWSDTQRIPLVAIRDRHGNSLVLTYGSIDRVVSVLDDAGRGLHFHYGSCHLLETVTDHTGSRKVKYEHDSEIEHLIRVTLPATAQYPGGLSTTYEYDSYNPHPAMQHNVVRIHDADNRLMVENDFAGPEAGWEFNSVVRQRLAGFEYQFEYQQIQYVWPDPENVDILSARTLVRPPDGSLHTYTFNYRGDLLDYRCRLNRDGSFRVVAYQWEHDAEGNVTKTVGPDGLRKFFTYDSANADPCARRNLLRVELAAPLAGIVPSRVLYQGQYDSRFQLVTRAIDEIGAETRYLYDLDVAPIGATGRLSRVQLPSVVGVDGAPQQSIFLFEHNTRGQLTAAVRPEGGRTELTYISGGVHDGFLLEITEDPTAAVLISKFEYDPTGFPTHMQSPGGRITGFTFNALGQIEGVSAPEVGGLTAQVRRWFDDSGSIIRLERPAGSFFSGLTQGTTIVDEFERDEVGNIRRVTLGSNTVSIRQQLQRVDHEGRPISIWDPSGTRSDRVYGENGALLSEVAAADNSISQKTSYFYDRAGRVRRIVRPLNEDTNFEYDVWGRARSITLPSGAVRTFEFGPNDRLLEERVEDKLPPGQVKRPLLHRQTYDYDKRGRLIATTLSSFREDPTTETLLKTRYLYDRDDKIRTLILPRGAQYHYDFDNLGRPSKTTDPHGNVRQFTYDASGDLTELTESEVENGTTHTTVRRFTYDARGRLTRSEHLGAASQIQYDDRDLPIEQHAPTGVTNRLQFDALGQVIENLIDSGGAALRSQFEYDLNGRLRRYIDPTGQSTTWERDALGRPVAIKPPDGTTWEYLIDTNARTLEQRMPSGNRVILEYAKDETRPSKMVCIAATGQEAVAPHEVVYDGMGRLVRASIGADSILRRYDSLGRLVEETARGKTVRMEYDDAAGAADLVYPDGRRERTEHNPTGQPTRIVLVTAGNLGGTSGEVLLEIIYSTAGRALRMLYGNGVEGELVYDELGRVIRIEYQKGGALLDSCRLRYDEDGHRAVVQYLGLPTRNLIHRFDGLGRLVEARSGFPLGPLPDVTAKAAQLADVAAARTAAATAPGAAFSLDGADARTKVTGLVGGAVDENYVLANDHRVVAVGANNISYNADGHRTADARYSYDLDALNRIKRVRDRATNAILVELQYDGLSRVAAGTTGGQEFESWFAGSTRIQEVLGSSPGTARQHSSHPLWPSPFCVVDAAGPAYIHQDEGWSTMCVSDVTGSVIERHRYDVFGATSAFAADGMTPLTVLRTERRWRGMPALAGTRLFRTAQRIYDPEIGVFTSRDPLLYADSPSPYGFAGHNPVDFADPTGLAKSPLGDTQSGPKFDDSWARAHQEVNVLTTRDANRAQDDRMLNLDLPPSELPFDWPEFKIPYTLLYGLKQSIYNPIKAHIFDERPKFIDSAHNVRTVPWRPDRMDAAVAYAQIASLFIPMPKPVGSIPVKLNPFGFLSEVEARNAALQEQVGQVAVGLEPFRRLTIAGGVTEIEGRQVSAIMVSDPTAYELLSSGKVPLPQGMELVPRLEPWPKTLLPEEHVERLVVTHLESGGARGGLVFTRGPKLLVRGRMSGFACDNCAAVWFKGEYPSWWHTNANPANWEIAPGKYVWDTP